MLLDALLREELKAKRRRDLKLRIKIDFITKLGITWRTGFGYMHKKQQHHARCNKPKFSYDTYAPFLNGNKLDLPGTSTERCLVQPTWSVLQLGASDVAGRRCSGTHICS